MAGPVEIDPLDSAAGFHINVSRRVAGPVDFSMVGVETESALQVKDAIAHDLLSRAVKFDPLEGPVAGPVDPTGYGIKCQALRILGLDQIFDRRSV